MLNLLFVELFSATGLNHLEEALHCLFFFVFKQSCCYSAFMLGKKVGTNVLLTWSLNVTAVAQIIGFSSFNQGANQKVNHRKMENGGVKFNNKRITRWPYPLLVIPSNPQILNVGCTRGQKQPLGSIYLKHGLGFKKRYKTQHLFHLKKKKKKKATFRFKKKKKPQKT